MKKPIDREFDSVNTNDELFRLGVELNRRYPELELGILRVIAHYVQTPRGPNDIDNAVNGLQSLVPPSNTLETNVVAMTADNSLLSRTTQSRLRASRPNASVDIEKSSRPDYGLIGALIAGKRRNN